MIKYHNYNKNKLYRTKDQIKQIKNKLYRTKDQTHQNKNLNRKLNGNNIQVYFNFIPKHNQGIYKILKGISFLNYYHKTNMFITYLMEIIIG